MQRVVFNPAFRKMRLLLPPVYWWGTWGPKRLRGVPHYMEEVRESSFEPRSSDSKGIIFPFLVPMLPVLFKCLA